MHELIFIFLLFMAALGVAACGLFAGLETGVYSLNRVRLRLRVHEGDPRAKMLDKLIQHPANMIVTLLVATNVATNIATSAGGVLLDAHSDSALHVIVTDVVIFTPIFFILAEVLPKDIFAAYADKLVYRFAPLLHWMTRLFTWIPILPLVRGISTLITRMVGQREDMSALSHTRNQVSLFVREGVGLGLLSDEQSAIAERVLGLSERRVDDVAVPWEKVIKVNLGDAPQTLWDLANRTSVSRIPVVGPANTVVGIVSLYDALLHPRESCPPISELMTKPFSLDRQMPLRAALSALQAAHRPLAIVTDKNKPVGVVSFKDLVEPITGELASW